jgi:hypothetical protein
MSEIEIRLTMFVQDNGMLRITGQAGYTDPTGIWHSARISDDAWDKLVMGNRKFMQELKKLVFP